MLMVIAALFAQVLVAPHAYTTGAPLTLATETGVYSIDLGLGCDGIVADMNVELLPGSGNVAAIAPLGSDQVCNIYISGKVSDTPCVMTDGACDVEGVE